MHHTRYHIGQSGGEALARDAAQLSIEKHWERRLPGGFVDYTAMSKSQEKTLAVPLERPLRLSRPLRATSPAVICEALTNSIENTCRQ